MSDYFYTLPFLILSMCSCFLIIIISLKFKSLRNGYPFKFIFILSIIDLMLSFNLFFPHQLIKNSSICLIQGFLNISLSMLDLFWKSYMSFEMYRVKFHQKDQLQFGYKKPLMILVFISCLFGVVPLCLKSFGESGPWCWITEGEYLLELRLGTFYIPTWILIFFNVFVALKVYFRLKKDFGDGRVDVVRKIRNYPVSLAIIYTPVTIFGPYLKDFNGKRGFYLFSLCCYSLIGVLNVIFYGIDDEVKGYIKSWWKKKDLKEITMDDSISLPFN